VHDAFDEQGIKLQLGFGSRFSATEAIADKEPFRSSGVFQKQSSVFTYC
jgi:hypothetical protein